MYGITGFSKSTQHYSAERKHQRYSHCSKIRYTLDTLDQDQAFEAVTRNISQGGLCLYVFEPIGFGETIQIISRLPVGSQTASVRWSRHVDGLYEVGLMFLEEGDTASSH